MLMEKSVQEFIAETASSSPAPGGGSASALAGALGTALAQMVINLTVGKKKYADVSEELAALLPRLAQIRADLEAAVDRDTAAFNQVMKAFFFPERPRSRLKPEPPPFRKRPLGRRKFPCLLWRPLCTPWQ